MTVHGAVAATIICRLRADAGWNNLDSAIVCLLEEAPPVSDLETKLGSCLHSLDTPNARSGVLIDAGNDSDSCWRIHQS